MLSTLADQMAISAATITALKEELAMLPKPNSTSVPAPPATKYFQFVPKMPTPRSWKEDELKHKVLNRLIPTAVADAGASSNCGAAPIVSTCGNYEIQLDPFLNIGRESNKVFRVAGGRLNPAT